MAEKSFDSIHGKALKYNYLKYSYVLSENDVVGKKKETAAINPAKKNTAISLIKGVHTL